MPKFNCNVAKAASAIFTSKDMEDVTLYRPYTDTFVFGVFSSVLGDCLLTVSGAPDSVIIEAGVRSKHNCFGHPDSKFSLELLEGESNDTYVNAARLSIASLEKQVKELEKNLELTEDMVFARTTEYVYDDDHSVNDTPAKVLEYNLTHPFPKEWLVEYKKHKDPDDNDSVDKYANVDLVDVDINKVTAVKCFFDDINENMYKDLHEVNPMMLKSVRNAINWVLAKAGSTINVDSKTVLAALMSCSLGDKKHVVLDEKEDINDAMLVNVPKDIFDLVILHRNNGNI